MVSLVRGVKVATFGVRLIADQQRGTNRLETSDLYHWEIETPRNDIAQIRRRNENAKHCIADLKRQDED